MAKKKSTAAKSPSSIDKHGADKPATLKDLLGSDTITKLQEQAAELKREEDERKEAARKKVEEARIEEQKKLENNFEHLLNTSDLDWHKYK